MTVYKILKWPDPSLHKACDPVKQVDSSIEELAANMAETMYAAPGVGLAANQIGNFIQLAVIDITLPEQEKNLNILINPKIVHAEGEDIIEEGCLSLPGFKVQLARPSHVVVEALDLKEKPIRIEAEGLMARALQHEIDHLHGKLFPDRLSRLKKNLLYQKVRKAIKEGTFGV